MDETGQATLAIQASGIDGIKVRIAAKAADYEAATEILDAEEVELRPIRKNAVFGIDDETSETSVISNLREHGRTLAAIETLTGGLLSSHLTLDDPNMETFKGATIMLLANGSDVSGKNSAGLALRLPKESREINNADVGLSVVTPANSENAATSPIVMGICCKEVTFT